MGTRCEQIVALAFDAFLTGNCESMAQVAALDAEIDRHEVECHALILRILALRQPVAYDLRFLAAALRLITDLERIGDEAVNIAERAVYGDSEAMRLVVDDLTAMARGALDMLHVSLDAFLQGDDDQADSIPGRDEAIDRGCATVIATMTEWLSEHAGDVLPGLRAIRVAKYLERIADHATNVAEEAIFVVRGEDIRRGRWNIESPERMPRVRDSRTRITDWGTSA
jgi:phosphate transport system protein